MTERERLIAARRRRQRQFNRAAWTLVALVSAQVVALEIVLRGWQRNDETSVFVGIGVSAALFLAAIVVFVRVQRRRARLQ